MSAPSVEVLIPTHNRPDLMRRALESARAQTYDGDLSVAVVFDRQEPDLDLSSDGPVPVRVLRNDRTPGLAGARNSAIVSSSADLIAFLDDDDHWLPGKLCRQVERFRATPGAEFATTAINVQFEDRTVSRLAGTATVTHDQLLDSRMAMLHSSTFLIRRAALLGDLGLVDESAPASQNEDWDLLLRASARGDIVHVDEPLVAVQWGSTSLFASAWESKVAAAHWILRKHPDIKSAPRGHARLLGQIAFAHAALGHRGQAVRFGTRAVAVRWREPRGYLAMVAATGLVRPSALLRVLHRRGRGI